MKDQSYLELEFQELEYWRRRNNQLTSIQKNKTEDYENKGKISTTRRNVERKTG